MSHPFMKIPFAGALATVLALASVAPAAVSNPKEGNYAQKKHHRYQIEFAYSGGKVSNAIHYDNCLTVPVAMPKIKVKHGHFSYDGTRKDVTNRKFKIHVDGKFTGRKVAKGTWKEKLVSGGSSCKGAVDYKAKRVGPVTVGG